MVARGIRAIAPSFGRQAEFRNFWVGDHGQSIALDFLGDAHLLALCQVCQRDLARAERGQAALLHAAQVRLKAQVKLGPHSREAEAAVPSHAVEGHAVCTPTPTLQGPVRLSCAFQV